MKTLYATCVEPILFAYGTDTCVPCFAITAQSFAIESTKVQQSVDKECALNCLKQFLNDCDRSGAQLCLIPCLETSTIGTVGDDIVESQNTPKVWASWSLIEAALACASALAGLTLWRKNQKTPKGESQYHQLMA